MNGLHRTVGILAVRPDDPQRLADPDERGMLDACANLIAISIERDQSRTAAERAEMTVQAEQLRNALLTSVSHDLRTPLATIAVTASSLLEGSPDPTWEAKREVLETVVDETRQLTRQVDNMLDMGRLNAGPVQLNREWQVLEELVEMALSRLRRELASYSVGIDIPRDFPLLLVAEDLMVQVLINLLENATRYTPAGGHIEVAARRLGERAEVSIADNGPGLPPGSESRVFEKFFRGTTTIADGRRGLGLGLAICHSIIQAHDGEIRARNRPGGGAEFTISLPCPQQSPQVTLDENSETEVG